MESLREFLLAVSATVFEIFTLKDRKLLIYLPPPCLTPPLGERLTVPHFLLVVLWNQVSISNGFRDILPQTSCAHRHNAESSLRMHDITRRVHPM